MHGSSISLFTLIEGLKRRNICISLIVPSNWHKDQRFIDKAEELGITLHYAHLVHTCDRDGWSRRPWRLRTFYQELKELAHQRRESYQQICKIIEQESPDIVHTNVGIIHDGYWVAKKYKIPHVFHIREYQDKDFGWQILPTKWLFKLFLIRSSAVICIADSIKKHFRLDHAKNATTIYNGIYSENSLCKIHNKHSYFLFASRVSPEKDPEDIIKTFGEFHKKHIGWQLKIAGYCEPEYLNKLLELAKQYNCENAVMFLGHVNNIPELMQSARALIVASYNEGFGRMSAEAAFNGCLIIGRNSAGTKEIIDKVGGYRFENNKELLTAMTSAAHLSESKYSAQAIISQQKAATIFSIEQNIQNTIDIYNRCLKRCTCI